MYSNFIDELVRTIRIPAIVWAFTGLLIPLISAVLATPLLLRSLGAEKFGLLSLCWAIVAMSGIADMGVGRALTLHLSGKVGGGDESKLQYVLDAVVTARWLALISGGVFGCAMLGLAMLDLQGLLQLTEATVEECFRAIVILAVSSPLQPLATVYRGLSETLLQFRGVSLVRALVGSLTFLLPAFQVFWTTDLASLVLGLAFVRMLGVILYLQVARRGLKRGALAPNCVGRFGRNHARTLIKNGAWMSVSAILAPLLQYSDRFVIAAAISTSAVSAYVVPYEMVTKLLVLAGAVTSVGYPVCAREAKVVGGALKAIYKRYLTVIAVSMAPIVLGVGVFVDVILWTWIGDAATREMSVIARILLVGVYFNGVASMCFALIQAMGRPRLTAQLHIFEAPIYIVSMIYCGLNFGVVGVAMVWTGRMVLDCLGLMFFARKLLGGKE